MEYNRRGENSDGKPPQRNYVVDCLNYPSILPLQQLKINNNLAPAVQLYSCTLTAAA